MDSLHKVQWWWVLMFSLMPVWTNSWTIERRGRWILIPLHSFVVTWKNYLNLDLTNLIKTSCNISIRGSYFPCAHALNFIRQSFWKLLCSGSFGYNLSVAIDVIDERNTLRYASELDFGIIYWTSEYELLFHNENKSHCVNFLYINQLGCKLPRAITRASSSWTIVKNQRHKGLNH